MTGEEEEGWGKGRQGEEGGQGEKGKGRGPGISPPRSFLKVGAYDIVCALHLHIRKFIPDYHNIYQRIYNSLLTFKSTNRRKGVRCTSVPSADDFSVYLLCRNTLDIHCKRSVSHLYDEVHVS